MPAAALTSAVEARHRRCLGFGGYGIVVDVGLKIGAGCRGRLQSVTEHDAVAFPHPMVDGTASLRLRGTWGVWERHIPQKPHMVLPYSLA